ncbi:MAG: competence/damage-inducible protein A [Oscillospiraceae bacterium]
MTAEIISVGTELLLGDILNTNAQYLSRELAALGINVYYETTVGDNCKRLTDAIELAKSRCDLLVFSGGLGPTDDDITKETVAKVFNDTLVYDDAVQEKIKSFFKSSGRTCPVNNKKQAMVPVNGISLPNENGTAPGAIFKDKDKYAVVLPGPPCECIPMFANSVIPYLASFTSKALVSLTLREIGIGESHLEELLKDKLNGANPTVAVYAKTGEVLIRITASAKNADIAKKMCEDTSKSIIDKLGDCFYGYADEDLVHTVVKLLEKNKLHIATAESCTGGMLSAAITSVSGASAVIEYGACTYCESIKEKMLGVNENTIDKYGVVSAQVAAEMAMGVLSKASADIGIGITGIAGPSGGSADKPVGLVYIAAADKNKVYTYKMLYINRSRDTVRTNAVMCALDMIRRMASGLEMRQCEIYKR